MSNINSMSSRVVRVTAFAKALVDAGVMTQEEINRTTRIVINCDPANGAVVLYVQRFVETNILDVVPTLNGIEITEVTDRLLTNDEIYAIVRGLTNEQLTTSYNREIEINGGPTAWARLLADELERRNNPAVILKPAERINGAEEEGPH